MDGGVFVSYRKGDDPGWAGRVRDSLANHFGDDHVFFDVDSIRGGQRWEEALDEALGASRTVVLVIGPQWLTCLKERQGGTEIDYHLREVSMALDKGIDVYPVRVHGAPMPDLDDLPEELRSRLPAIQWMEVHENLFAASMARVISDIERATGNVAAPRTDNPAVLLQEATVGPWGSDAGFHEIADAVAAVAAGGKIRVRPGRYLKQVVLEKAIAVVGEGRGEVLLDCDAVPCIEARSVGAVVRGLKIRASAQEGAVGIRVESGDLTVEDVRVEAKWVPTSTAIHATGAGTRLTLGATFVSSIDVGIHVEEGAAARIERTSVAGATSHALVIESGADPKVSGCSFAGAGASTVLVANDGRGTIDDCAIGSDGGPTVEIRTGGSPTIRGRRGSTTHSGALAKVPDRLAKARSAGPGALAPDDKDRTGWTVVVADDGAGTVTLCDLAELQVRTGGNPTVTDCAIGVVRGADQGRGSICGCAIGQVILTAGADPTFRDGCTIAPDRGVKVTVEVRSGAAGTFEDCEIVGRNVRDGSPDPAVLSDGGAPVLRRCVVKNPGEGALWVGGGGRATIDGGELRSSVSGPALVVDHGEAEVAGVVIHGGVRIGGEGRVVFDGGEVHADPISGFVLEVQSGGELRSVETSFRGPGFAAARKVGRWIEARSDKVKGKVAGALGATPPVRIGDGSITSFTSCSFIGIGSDGVVAPTSGAGFDHCNLDGDPYP